MAKYTDSIRRRNRYIEGLKSECLTEMSKDFDTLMDERGEDIVFEKPISTYGYDSQWYAVHGVTYMAVTDNEGEVLNELPAFYIGDVHHMEFVENVPYEVALNVYRSVFEMNQQKQQETHE